MGVLNNKRCKVEFVGHLFRLSFGFAERRALARYSFLVRIYGKPFSITIYTNKVGMSKIARHKGHPNKAVSNDNLKNCVLIIFFVELIFFS